MLQNDILFSDLSLRESSNCTGMCTNDLNWKTRIYVQKKKNPNLITPCQFTFRVTELTSTPLQNIRSGMKYMAAKTNPRVKLQLTVALTCLWRQTKTRQSDNRRHCHIAISSGEELLLLHLTYQGYLVTEDRPEKYNKTVTNIMQLIQKCVFS